MALISVIRRVSLSGSRLGLSSHLVSSGSVNLQKNSRFISSVLSKRRLSTLEVLVEETSPNMKENKSSGTTQSIFSPPICKGMTILDKSAFHKNITIPTITLQGVQGEHDKVFRLLKPYYLKALKFQNVQDPQEDGTRKVYLNPDMLSELDLEEFLASLKCQSYNPSVFKSIHLETVPFTFDHWTLTQLLDSILPDEEAVSAYSRMGHLLHLNLREPVLPYKKVIGQVFLERFCNVKTVVNKINTIDNTYRNFEMEVLAGEPDTVVTVREAKCEFDFDFAKVYWNTRLVTEHERIFERLNNGDTLYDVFAGVGPFAIPAGKKKARVFANDLNPESFKWLEHNVKKNKVDKYVQIFNQDGRDFITNVIKRDLEEQIDLCEIAFPVFHIAMNLPGMAVDFLSAFWSLLEGREIDGLKVVVHVYCFAKYEENKLEVTKRKELALSLVKEKLDFGLQPSHIEEIFLVRKVAPNKDMFRISFKLPHQILTAPRNCLKRKFEEINEESTVSNG